MIIIGIVLLGVGLLVSLLAFRGRVAARGVFCRKCRFDLAGLEIEADGAKCPECGSEVFLASARRGLIRQRSRVGLVAAAILMFAGGGGIWVGAAGKTGSMIAAMPDPVVLWLTDFGVDEALDELVVRVSKVPGTMSAKSWDDAIEHGLAFQADKTLVWDVRWGEVLYQASLSQRMSAKQLESYFMTSMVLDVQIRDRVHHGAQAVAYTTRFSTVRNNAITTGTTGYRYRVGLSEFGVVDAEPAYRNEGGGAGFQGELSAASRSAGGWVGTSSELWNLESVFGAAPGTQVPIYADYAVRLEDSIGIVVFSASVRTLQLVNIFDSTEPLVRLAPDLKLPGDACEGISVSPVRASRAVQTPSLNMPVALLSFECRSQGLPESIALSVSALIDGEEIVFGSWVSPSDPEKQQGATVSWSMIPDRNEDIDAAREVLQRILEQETIDLFFRTDPSLAEKTPGIDRVLDLEFVVKNVPIKIIDQEPSGWVLVPKNEFVPASCSE